VADGSIPQTNIVRQDGRRGALMVILKSGTASTLDRGERRAESAAQGEADCAPGVEDYADRRTSLSLFADSVQGVIREAVIAAMLTGLMILLFLGSWRSTIIIRSPFRCRSFLRLSCWDFWAKRSTS